MYMVDIVVGSNKTDWPQVEESGLLNMLSEIGISWRASAISAHRNQQELATFCKDNLTDKTMLFIAVAGMAAALPGAIAALRTERPVIGVPLATDVFGANDALMSMVQMPPDRPVLVPGVGVTGLRKSAIAAAQILSLSDQSIYAGLQRFLEKHGKLAEIGFAGSGSADVTN
jgi:phosphoribosylaminoimidazole carboxylase PurE protein